MSATQIEDAEFVQAVRDEAAEHPDYVYPKVDGGRCRYVHEGVGSCLIGRALVKVGVPITEVADLDTGSDTAARCRLPRFGLSKRVVEWADRLQSKQDIGGEFDEETGLRFGLPWGEAVAAADAGVGDPLAGTEGVKHD